MPLRSPTVLHPFPLASIFMLTVGVLHMSRSYGASIKPEEFQNRCSIMDLESVKLASEDDRGSSNVTVTSGKPST